MQKHLLNKDSNQSSAGTLGILKKKTAHRQHDIIRKRSPRTNWFVPKVWPAIDAAAKANLFRSAQTVAYLQRQAGGKVIYGTLAPGTVSHWIDTKAPTLRWKSNVLEKVKAEGARAAPKKRLGRPRKLVSCDIGAHVFLPTGIKTIPVWSPFKIASRGISFIRTR